MAVNATGKVYLVWNDNRNGDTDIYYAYRAANGRWRGNRRLNSDTEQPFNKDCIGIDDAGYVDSLDRRRNGHDDICFHSGTATGGWTRNSLERRHGCEPNKVQVEF